VPKSPDVPALPFFTSATSGPARRMESLLAVFAHRERGRLRVVTVDADASRALADVLGVTEIPTLVLLRGRRAVASEESACCAQSNRAADRRVRSARGRKGLTMSLATVLVGRAHRSPVSAPFGQALLAAWAKCASLTLLLVSPRLTRRGLRRASSRPLGERCGLPCGDGSSRPDDFECGDGRHSSLPGDRAWV
jgi:thioredoxin-like negative regulator of GroEL